MTDTNRLGATRAIIGVDTHRDEHVAVAIGCLGAWLSQRRLGHNLLETPFSSSGDLGLLSSLTICCCASTHTRG